MTTLYQGNFLDFDTEIKDNSIDLLLTDPPYNISEDGAKPVWIDKETGKNKSTIHNQKFSETFDENWDSVSHDEFLIQIETWAKFWFKKLRKGGTFAIFISDQYISYLWKIMEAEGFEPKRIWTWKKPAAVPFNRKVNPVSACEYVLFGIKPGGKRTFNADAKKGSLVERYAAADKVSSIVYKLFKNSLPSDDINAIFAQAAKQAQEMLNARKTTDDLVECVIPNTLTYSGGLGKNKIHPTEKPVEILEYFIELLSNKGDTVLDTFGGSGSTAIAAINMQRNSIIIEQDLAMFNKMKNRIEVHEADPNVRFFTVD
jgi:DNA modification methylase